MKIGLKIFEKLFSLIKRRHRMHVNIKINMRHDKQEIKIESRKSWRKGEILGAFEFSAVRFDLWRLSW